MNTKETSGWGTWARPGGAISTNNELRIDKILNSKGELIESGGVTEAGDLTVLGMTPIGQSVFIYNARNFDGFARAKVDPTGAFSALVPGRPPETYDFFALNLPGGAESVIYSITLT
ncbi:MULTISPECIES: hypothetical protein [unclassified Pseudomonas]|uniref:hypothetical protein n=1 Tax=unclassified Pseudomonas TaxID=196821 RepID=UPI000A1E2EA1|nr:MULTISPECIES: hypothetical protein [unclassified Pseudomonas]MDI2142923.1 hypothetical protein [Pseudomonas sp. ITA]